MRSTIHFILVFSFFLFMSCPDKNNDTIPVFNQTCIITQHHREVVGPIDIYIRYNNPVFPGTRDLTVFDTMLTTDAQGRLCIINMPEGKSWLVGFGRDVVTQDSLKGSMSITIKHPRDSKDTIMYVSEVH